MSTPTNQNDRPSGRGVTATGAAAAARGTSGVWLMGAAIVTAIIMIVSLLGMIAGEGIMTFWPKPIERVELNDGSVLMGKRVREGTGPEGRRVLYRVGNRDLGQTPFRWVAKSDIASTTQPSDAVLLEREAWGIWIGTLEAVVEIDEQGVYQPVEGDAFELLRDRQPSARAAIAKADSIRSGPLSDYNRQISEARLNLAEARIAAGREPVRILPAWGWGAALIAAPLLLLAGGWTGWKAGGRRGQLIGAAALTSLGALSAVAAWVEAPSGDPAARLTELEATTDTRIESLYEQIAASESEIEQIEQGQAALAVHVRDATSGRLAPAGQSELGRPLPVASIVRVVESNRLTLTDKIGVYLSRWAEFLGGQPRSANTEGGIFPVIFGTVLLTLLLTVSVLPLGVIAALYMREYAKQGPLISTLRVAINNLAGVPSIVYGVFGLGFFCYTVGKYVDTGPTNALPAAGGIDSWWGIAILTAILAFGAVTCGVLAKPVPGQHTSGQAKWLRLMSVGAWLGCAVLAAVLLTTTPYFNGFFEGRASEGSPTFGGRGLLWASLTLALLTLPVVIVSTEEAIAAVPASMRQGSYGCGASKWQTIRNIVLPGAMPGIMTGAILAMARGAGEVAPLMVVGAVKLAPDLPFEARFPFVFADRSFMHLGFHIFDLGFQSPDSEAARGMVWTTTLVLITLVVLLNVTAIVLRAKLRARAGSGQF